MRNNRGLQVVRYLADFERVTVTQVAEDLGMARQNARKWLKAAVQEGLAVEVGTMTVHRAQAPLYALAPLLTPDHVARSVVKGSEQT